MISAVKLIVLDQLEAGGTHLQRVVCEMTGQTQPLLAAAVILTFKTELFQVKLNNDSLTQAKAFPSFDLRMV